MAGLRRVGWTSVLHTAGGELSAAAVQINLAKVHENIEVRRGAKESLLPAFHFT
jgi:hypothetical protein